jgi:hypothetical protein
VIKNTNPKSKGENLFRRNKVATKKPKLKNPGSNTALINEGGTKILSENKLKQSNTIKLILSWSLEKFILQWIMKENKINRISTKSKKMIE